MLTPEEVRALLLPVNAEYIKAHGVDFDHLYSEFYYDENDIYHYDRTFDFPMEHGGQPFTGLRYEFFSNSDQLANYTQMKEGYHFGDEVEFYMSGALESYERIDDTEHYCYEWYESGALKTVTEWNRRDRPDFYRIRAYDKTGRLIWMQVKCEITATYKPDDTDSRFDFAFHENGEFRQITYKVPTADDFYSGIKFDSDGIPVRFVVNPHFIDDSLSKQLSHYCSRYKTYDPKTHRFQDGVLQYPFTDKYGTRWFREDGHILFHNGMHGDKFLSYREGKPWGPQYIYYPNGQIQEFYCVDTGGAYHRHVHWYPNGMMREATVYSHRAVMLHVTFDNKGNLLSYQLNADVFKKSD